MSQNEKSWKKIRNQCVVRSEQNFRGMSYGDWAEAWSNWLFSSYPDSIEAEGPMLFLRGNLEHYNYRIDNNSAARTGDNSMYYDRTGDKGIVIPQDKAVFIPVMTAMHFIGGEYESQVSKYEQQIRYAAQKENDKSGGIYAMIQSLDNKWEPIVEHLMEYRVTSSTFKLIVSENNPFLEKVAIEEKMVPGEYQAVTDGFFIILKELPANTSWRLRFGGKGKQKSYRTDAVYDIHITSTERSQVTVRDVTSVLLNKVLEVNKEDQTFKGVLSVNPVLTTFTNIDDEIDPLQKLPE